MRINIPFNAWSRARLADGRKCMTTRTKRYGKPGDIFVVDGRRFRIVDHYRLSLCQIASDYYRKEGCESPDEFRKVWKEIHPRKGFDPDQYVWLHEFEEVSGG